MSNFEPKIYKKDRSFDSIYDSVNKRFFFQSRLLPFGILALGVFVLITQVIIPLVWFKTQDEISKPISSSVLGVATGFSEFSFNELSNSKNTTQNVNVPEYFYLTIPKLGINNANIETNPASLNPDRALGRYIGSKIPGDAGNTFIYGHSVLPWFYNPKNYKTIFSTIYKLQKGDALFISYNNKSYYYKVTNIKIELPKEVDPLENWSPTYLGESTITLMTCYPSGLKSKRILVNAVLIDSPD